MIEQQNYHKGNQRRKSQPGTVHGDGDCALSSFTVCFILAVMRGKLDTSIALGRFTDLIVQLNVYLKEPKHNPEENPETAKAVFKEFLNTYSYQSVFEDRTHTGRLIQDGKLDYLLEKQKTRLDGIQSKSKRTKLAKFKPAEDDIGYCPAVIILNGIFRQQLAFDMQNVASECVSREERRIIKSNFGVSSEEISEYLEPAYEAYCIKRVGLQQISDETDHDSTLHCLTSDSDISSEFDKIYRTPDITQMFSRYYSDECVIGEAHLLALKPLVEEELGSLFSVLSCSYQGYQDYREVINDEYVEVIKAYLDQCEELRYEQKTDEAYFGKKEALLKNLSLESEKPLLCEAVLRGYTSLNETDIRDWQHAIALKILKGEVFTSEGDKFETLAMEDTIFSIPGIEEKFKSIYESGETINWADYWIKEGKDVYFDKLQEFGHWLGGSELAILGARYGVNIKIISKEGVRKNELPHNHSEEWLEFTFVYGSRHYDPDPKEGLEFSRFMRNGFEEKATFVAKKERLIKQPERKSTPRPKEKLISLVKDQEKEKVKGKRIRQLDIKDDAPLNSTLSYLNYDEADDASEELDEQKRLEIKKQAKALLEEIEKEVRSSKDPVQDNTNRTKIICIIVISILVLLVVITSVFLIYSYAAFFGVFFAGWFDAITCYSIGSFIPGGVTFLGGLFGRQKIVNHGDEKLQKREKEREQETKKLMDSLFDKVNIRIRPGNLAELRAFETSLIDCLFQQEIPPSELLAAYFINVYLGKESKSIIRMDIANRKISQKIKKRYSDKERAYELIQQAVHLGYGHFDERHMGPNKDQMINLIRFLANSITYTLKYPIEDPAATRDLVIFYLVALHTLPLGKEILCLVFQTIEPVDAKKLLKMLLDKKTPQAWEDYCGRGEFEAFRGWCLSAFFPKIQEEPYQKIAKKVGATPYLFTSKEIYPVLHESLSCISDPKEQQKLVLQVLRAEIQSVKSRLQGEVFLSDDGAREVNEKKKAYIAAVIKAYEHFCLDREKPTYQPLLDFFHSLKDEDVIKACYETVTGKLYFLRAGLKHNASRYQAVFCNALKDLYDKQPEHFSRFLSEIIDEAIQEEDNLQFHQETLMESIFQRKGEPLNEPNPKWLTRLGLLNYMWEGLDENSSGLIKLALLDEILSALQDEGNLTREKVNLLEKQAAHLMRLLTSEFHQAAIFGKIWNYLSSWGAMDEPFSRSRLQEMQDKEENSVRERALSALIYLYDIYTKTLYFEESLSDSHLRDRLVCGVKGSKEESIIEEAIKSSNRKTQAAAGRELIQFFLSGEPVKEINLEVSHILMVGEYLNQNPSLPWGEKKAAFDVIKYYSNNYSDYGDIHRIDDLRQDIISALAVRSWEEDHELLYFFEKAICDLEEDKRNKIESRLWAIIQMKEAVTEEVVTEEVVREEPLNPSIIFTFKQELEQKTVLNHPEIFLKYVLRCKPKELFSFWSVVLNSYEDFLELELFIEERMPGIRPQQGQMAIYESLIEALKIKLLFRGEHVIEQASLFQGGVSLLLAQQEQMEIMLKNLEKKDLNLQTFYAEIRELVKSLDELPFLDVMGVMDPLSLSHSGELKDLKKRLKSACKTFRSSSAILIAQLENDALMESEKSGKTIRKSLESFQKDSSSLIKQVKKTRRLLFWELHLESVLLKQLQQIHKVSVAVLEVPLDVLDLFKINTDKILQKISGGSEEIEMLVICFAQLAKLVGVNDTCVLESCKDLCDKFVDRDAVDSRLKDIQWRLKAMEALSGPEKLQKINGDYVHAIVAGWEMPVDHAWNALFATRQENLISKSVAQELDYRKFEDLCNQVAVLQDPDIHPNQAIFDWFLDKLLEDSGRKNKKFITYIQHYANQHWPENFQEMLDEALKAPQAGSILSHGHSNVLDLLRNCPETGPLAFYLDFYIRSLCGDGETIDLNSVVALLKLIIRSDGFDFFGLRFFSTPVREGDKKLLTRILNAIASWESTLQGVHFTSKASESDVLKKVYEEIERQFDEQSQSGLSRKSFHLNALKKAYQNLGVDPDLYDLDLREKRRVYEADGIKSV